MSASPTPNLIVPSSNGAQQQQSPRVFTISCTSCRQRKIKCTRMRPCQPCEQAGYDCEFPQRQRVSRKKKRNTAPPAKVADLANRLAGVEALLSQMIAKEQEDEATDSSADDMVSDLDPVGNVEERYSGCSFWKALCEQIEGLHEVVSEPLGNFHAVPNGSPSPALDQMPKGLSNLIAKNKPSVVDLTHPSPAQVVVLLDVFTRNIDPVIKVLHIPSLRARIQDWQTGQKGKATPKHLDVLVAAVFFASITSMSEQECQECLQVSKMSAISGYKAAVEDGLARSNYLGRAEMANLQSLVLFIGCLRSTDTSTAPWTMVAVVIRLAHMLNLHRDGQGVQYKPFEREMRRRLWWQIVLLDMRASEDWGGDLMIRQDSYNTSLPTNIYECDMATNTRSTFVNIEGVTEMTFGLMFHEASKMVKLLHPPVNEQEPRSFQERLKIVLACQKELNENFIPRHSSDAPISWATQTMAKLIIYKAWLLVHYPMQPQDWTTMATSVKREDLLMTSVMILELSHRLESNEETKQWRWFFETHIQWHALAVTLVELCVQGPSTLKDKAWAIVDIVYDGWSQHVVGKSNGFVWLPIRKLYTKAQQTRLSFTSSPAQDLRTRDSITEYQKYDSCVLTDHSLTSHNLLIPGIDRDAVDYHELYTSNSDLAWNLAQTDYRISTFDVNSWDCISSHDHDDPSAYANWAEWEGIVQDAGGLIDQGILH